MSHPEQLAFVALTQRCFPEFFSKQKVLEIGSLDINGTVRDFFSECDYTGIDVGEGPGVDVVAGGHSYDAPVGYFDVVISCECMEHNPYWIDTLENIIRMLRAGGLCLITCAAPGRKEHGTTRSSPDSSPMTVATGWEHYRNLDESNFATVPRFWNGFDQCGTWKNYRAFDFYFAGLKRSAAASPSPDAIAEWGSYAAAVEVWLRGRNAGSKANAKRLALAMLGEAGVSRLRRLYELLGGPAG